jgi:hypothetical protein
MDKKDLKFYVTPSVESVVMETEGFLCNSIESPSRSREVLDFEGEEEE